MKHLLFLCSENIDRSPCAEELFKNHPEFEAKSAGLSPLTDNPVTEWAIEWADVIFVMNEREEGHKSALLKRFPKAIEKEIIILDISNDLCRYDPELERLLRIKLLDWLE